MHGSKRRVNHHGTGRCLTRWYEYISELYSDNNKGDIPQIEGLNREPMTHREVEAALKRLPMKNSSATDDITVEMPVTAGQNGLAELVKLSQIIYDKYCFPEELNRSIFISLPKVTGTDKCDKHLTIRLMGHVTKLVLQVIMNRLRCRTLQEVAFLRTAWIHAGYRYKDRNICSNKNDSEIH